VSGSLLGHVNEVWAAAFSPDGRALVSGAKGGGLNLWPLQRAQTNHLAPAGWVPLGFSTEARLLAFNPHAGSVAVFDPVTRRKEDRFTLERSAGSAGFPPAILGNAPPPGPDLRSSPPGPGDGPAGFMPLVAFSADFRRLVCSGADGTVEIRDAGSAETMRLHAAPGRIDRLLLSPDGRDLIVGGSDGRLNWWNLDHPTNAVARLEARRAILSPDGRILAAIAGTNHVELWDVATVSRRTVFTLDPAPGPSVALSPDGILLAATAGPDDVDHAVRLWDTDTGELLGACEGHKQPVWAIAFAPDGRTLASSSDDGTVKLWNLATRQELLSIRKPGVTARRLLFSPDGRMLLIAGGGPQAGDAMLVIQAPTLEEIKVAEGGAGGR
jgi:WD40 repeat protein